MAKHDDLCGLPEHVRANVPGCRCLLIEAVEIRTRADEQKRHGDNCRGMWDEWLHDLWQQVEALPRASMADGRYLLWEEQVLGLIDAERTYNSNAKSAGPRTETASPLGSPEGASNE